jgi:hypothetical protein
MKEIFPEQGLKPAWEESLAVMNPKGALDGKTKELIGLAVAAQIPWSCSSTIGTRLRHRC